MVGRFKHMPSFRPLLHVPKATNPKIREDEAGACDTRVIQKRELGKTYVKRLCSAAVLCQNWDRFGRVRMGIVTGARENDVEVFDLL